MYLAIDIGNSQIVCGVLQENTLMANWRLSTDHTKTADEYDMTLRSLFEIHKIDLTKLDGCIMTSVVPPLTHTFETLLHSLARTSSLYRDLLMPAWALTLRYNNP